MKNSKNSIYTRIGLGLLLINALVLGACNSSECSETEKVETADAVINIEGVYECSGECIVTNASGERTVITVSVETDKVKRYSDETKGLYQVSITGSDNFTELELGALSGLTLRTATAQVSDSTYPVLEEYVFDTDESGKVIGYTKTVRNPDPKNFKTCVIYGKKVK